MKIIELEQRSQQWLDLRRSKIGASDCAAVMRDSRYKTPRKLWREKILGEEGCKINPAMQKGIDLEDEARAVFSRKLSFDFQPLVALHDLDDWIMASLDGWDADKKALLEIKVVGRKVFEAAERGDVPIEYIWQVQHQICVAQPDFAFIGFYYKPDDGSDAKTVEIPIQRSVQMISDLRVELDIFYHNYMLAYVEPPIAKGDVIERRDPAWYGKAAKWKEVKAKIAALEVEEKELREGLIELAGEESCIGYGVSATRYECKGRVDYTKIPELQDIDLDPYRSESKWTWRLS